VSTRNTETTIVAAIKLLMIPLGIVIYVLLSITCSQVASVAGVVPDYRNGKSNALVCPNDGPCFQCDHATAWRYVILYQKGKWDGGIVFLPLNKKP
jgi:hypothetical protein